MISLVNVMSLIVVTWLSLMGLGWLDHWWSKYISGVVSDLKPFLQLLSTRHLLLCGLTGKINSITSLISVSFMALSMSRISCGYSCSSPLSSFEVRSSVLCTLSKASLVYKRPFVLIHSRYHSYSICFCTWSYFDEHRALSGSFYQNVGQSGSWYMD